MAGQTCRRQTRELAARVAVLALHALVRADQWEIAFVVIEGHLVPILRRVTRSAIRSEAAAMLIMLRVTRITITGGAFVHVILMAFLA
jgi:hypothetical protein